MFYFLAVVAVGSSAAVAFSRNLARAIFMLLFALGAVAAYYAWLGADFLFAVQLLIYVGGILIILVFAMMISQEFPISYEPARPDKLLSGAVVSLIFLTVMLFVAFGGGWPELASVEPVPSTSTIGEQLLTTYLLPFEVAGLVLVAALVAAMVLTRTEERESSSTSGKGSSS